MTDFSSQRAPATDRGALDAIRVALLDAAPAVIRLWAARRRDRRELATLDQHMLDDIGLSARAAQDEASKPFWRD